MKSGKPSKSIMDNWIKISLIIFSSISLNGWSQSISSDVPETVQQSKSYVFYLHGGIVQDQGADAVSELFGPYKYRKILETLRDHGYYVISEVRPKGTEEIFYAKKVSSQIDSLHAKGVEKENIIVVGASLGAYITVELAHIRNDPGINYVLIGLCSEYAVGYFLKYKDKLCGNFLSIYEKSDQKGSCMSILDDSMCKTGVKEHMTNTGKGHGFLYQPYDAWMIPLISWINMLNG